MEKCENQARVTLDETDASIMHAPAFCHAAHYTGRVMGFFQIAFRSLLTRIKAVSLHGLRHQNCCPSMTVSLNAAILISQNNKHVMNYEATNMRFFYEQKKLTQA